MAPEVDSARQPLRVGDWHVEPETGFLRRGEESVRLEPRVMQVLVHLAELRGSVASKESIIDAVWADTFVGEAALSRCVSELRRALGDDARAPRYIETLPKRGYRLVAEVTVPGASSSGAQATATEPRHRPLKTLVAAGIVLLLFLAWWQSRPRRNPAAGPVGSIAVVPLRALSEDPAHRFFAEGLTGQLITALATVENLTVVPVPARDRAGLPPTAEQVGVDAVLTGAIQQSADRILITLELVHTETESAIWAGSYQERNDNDLLRVEQEVSAQAAREIALALAARAGSAGVVAAADPRAVAALDRGMRLVSKETPVDLLRALDQFRQATEIDPGFARAWAAIAHVQATLAWNNWSRPEIAYADARAAAHTALDLNPALPEAHALLAAVAAELNQDWLEAERRFHAAIDLDPASAFAHERFGRYLRRLGRIEEALDQSALAMEADPDSTIARLSHGWNLTLSGQLGAAEEIYLQLLDMDSVSEAYAGLCAVYNLRGDAEAAVSVCERAAAQPGREPTRSAVAVAWATAGDRARARAIAEELAAEYGPHDRASTALATAWVAAERPDLALLSLENAVEHREIGVAAVLANPYLRSLHGEPRFQALLERMLIPVPHETNANDH